MSLKKYCNPDTFIVVVDNGSVNGKSDCLKAEFKPNPYIHFLKSEKNLGFAKGNNIGFKYAKDVLNAEIIILTNNDIVFSGNNFVDSLVSIYQSLKFDIAGPKIISLVDKKNQNPVHIIYPTKFSIFKRIIKFAILYLLSFFNIDKNFQNQFGSGIEEYKPFQDKEYQLHGACLFFGPRYIDMFDGLYPKTFMYGEESILKYFSDKNEMKMIYIDQLSVYHKEGSSTNSVFTKGGSRRRFFYRWNIYSCFLLLYLNLRNKKVF